MKSGNKVIKVKKRRKLPIKHWSYSSLMAFLRNPLAWHKRYVEEIYDTPSTPASIIGRAGHLALEHFYSGMSKGEAIKKGLDYLKGIGDFEIDFGRLNLRASGSSARKKKREAMEKEYLQAVSYYLKRPPKHKVLGVEIMGLAKIDGLELPVKAISDLVVASSVERGAVDIVDHKFVKSFSKGGASKPLFVIQSIFNYYTVREIFGKPVGRFIVYECKKTKNADGRSQMRRYILDYKKHSEDFSVFHRLINDATKEISRRRIYLPNPSDMFDGDNSFDIYKLDLVTDQKAPDL